MNIKEQIVEILNEVAGGECSDFYMGQTVDQILDLVLNSLTIEKKTQQQTLPEVSLQDTLFDIKVRGWNSCIDAYEELKNKLRT